MSNLLVSVEWKDNLRFVARNERGQSTEINATVAEGKARGITPMELLIMALGGCTAIDVVNILQKQREELTHLTVEVSGERKDEPPRSFHKIHVQYSVEGRDLEETKVQRAIKLSEEKYCSVRATLMGSITFTSSYRIAEK